MLELKKYANGQSVYDLDGSTLTYFYKDGTVKAVGEFQNDRMEGEWKFYRQTGQLWQVGNFKAGKKNGSWVRYDKNDAVEYSENFIDDKKEKQKR